MPRRATDWTGFGYGYLTITGQSSKRDSHGRVLWNYSCSCGSTGVIDIRDLRKWAKRGSRASCGCQRRRFISESHQTHGMSGHPAFAVWNSMVQRCSNPNHPAWKNYGGRGITVCERWVCSFENFWTDMGGSYQFGLELDRKNNAEGYSPDNCRWVTRRVNCRNRRNSLLCEYAGESRPVKEVAELTRINYTTLLYRLDHGVTGEQLFSAPDVSRKFTT